MFRGVSKDGFRATFDRVVSYLGVSYMLTWIRCRFVSFSFLVRYSDLMYRL